MHTPLVVGVLFAVGIAAAGMAAFFVRAWLYRREERELAYFGVSVSGFSAIAVLEAFLYWRSYDPSFPLDRASLLAGASLPGRIALPTLLHFALRFARVRHVRRVMLPVYLIQIPFAALAISGRLWSDVPDPQLVEVLGLEVMHTRAALSPLGAAFYTTLPAIIVSVAALLAMALRRRQHGALPAFIGSCVLLAALAHDVRTGAGVLQSIPLTSLGLFGLSCGVSLTLLTRYGRRSAELEAKTAALQQRSRERERSYAELERKRALLVQRDQLATAGELAAMIAHEVRNPLAIVTNAVASLRRGVTSKEQWDLLLGIIDEEMTRLDRLLSQLMDYARPLQPRAEPVSLRELAGRSLALVKDRPAIVCDLEEEAETVVDADPELLRQAFDNIVINAAQAMAKGGTLRVRFASCDLDDEPAVAVTFADDGEGMNAQSLEMAMAPFFTTRPTGTGLGLPWVSRIVEAHGGRLRIKSTRNEGTTVRVTLPCRLTLRDSLRPARDLALAPPA